MDLIERLRKCAASHGWTGDPPPNSVAALHLEAAAALEAAREDAERYRWLRAMATQQADSLGPIFRIDVRRSAPYLFNFDAAIDAALAQGQENKA